MVGSHSMLLRDGGKPIRSQRYLLPAYSPPYRTAKGEMREPDPDKQESEPQRTRNHAGEYAEVPRRQA